MENRFYARDTIIEIDLDAVKYNVNQFRKHLGQGPQIMAMVKADAYGHGAVFVARAALDAGVSYLGVSFVDEGIELREAGIEAPILVVGYTSPQDMICALEHDLAVTVFSDQSLSSVVEAAVSLHKKAKVHVKVDTGMGRIGLQPEEAFPFIQRAMQMSHVEIEGVFTHFSTADEADKTYFYTQEKLFQKVIRQLEEHHLVIPLIHSANSAASIEMPERVYNMIRLGISLYGFYPSEEVNQQAVFLQPVLTLRAKVVHVKKPKRDTGISYGKTFITNGDQHIATVHIGYADGINRHLSNCGYALIHGVKVPIVGRISMDQLMLDVTAIAPVDVGDEVVFYGQQGDQMIHVDEVARLLQTINYEVTCMLGRRIPRIYFSDGKPIAVVNYLRQKKFVHDPEKS